MQALGRSGAGARGFFRFKGHPLQAFATSVYQISSSAERGEQGGRHEPYIPTEITAQDGYGAGLPFGVQASWCMSRKDWKLR
jgi:hypothetical protein